MLPQGLWIESTHGLCLRTYTDPPPVHNGAMFELITQRRSIKSKNLKTKKKNFVVTRAKRKDSNGESVKLNKSPTKLINILLIYNKAIAPI